MFEYTVPIGIDGKLSKDFVLRSDGAWIPTDLGNSDYQRYLNPEAEQSTPSLAVDEA
jgi:hypothetical protein